MQEVNITQEIVRDDETMTMIADRGFLPITIGTKVYEVTRYRNTFYNVSGDGKVKTNTEFALTDDKGKYWSVTKPVSSWSANKPIFANYYTAISMTGGSMKRKGEEVRLEDDGAGSITPIK